jgi:hypothetical protein
MRVIKYDDVMVLKNGELGIVRICIGDYMYFDSPEMPIKDCEIIKGNFYD